jgi:transposase
MERRYPTDLTDEQWALVEPLLPPAKRGGRPRTVDLRLVLDTIFYLTKTGCQWAMLPTDLAKRSTTYDYFTAWKADGTWQALPDALRRQVRVAAGRAPEPRKAAIDSQTVKGSEAGGGGGAGAVAVPVGDRAIQRLDGEVPAQQRGLRAGDVVERGDGAGGDDPSDAPAAEAGPDRAAGRVPLSAQTHEKSGLTFRIDCKRQMSW